MCADCVFACVCVSVCVWFSVYACVCRCVRVYVRCMCVCIQVCVCAVGVFACVRACCGCGFSVCLCTRLIPKLFPGHVLGNATFRSTSFVSQSPGTIANQWECEDLDRTTKTSDIGRKEFWHTPRTRACAGVCVCLCGACVSVCVYV